MAREFTKAELDLIDEHRQINVEDNNFEYEIEQFIKHVKAYGIDVSHRTETYYPHKSREVKSRQVPEVYYSISCSQGDGASFACNDFTIADILRAGAALVNLPEDDDHAYLKTSEEPVPTALRAMYTRLYAAFEVHQLVTDYLRALDEVKFTCTCSSSHYSHSGTMTLNIDWGDVEPDDAVGAERAFVDLVNEQEKLLLDDLRGIADALHDELVAEYEYQTEDEQVWETLKANEITPEDDDEEDDTPILPTHPTDLLQFLHASVG